MEIGEGMYTNIYKGGLHMLEGVRHGGGSTQRRVIYGEELHMKEDKHGEGLQLEKDYTEKGTQKEELCTENSHVRRDARYREELCM